MFMTIFSSLTLYCQYGVEGLKHPPTPTPPLQERYAANTELAPALDLYYCVFFLIQ